MPTDFWGWLKLLGPYIFEIIKVMVSGPNKQAVENLKARGVIKTKPSTEEKSSKGMVKDK